MECPEAYREILNCLPQPACLLDGQTLLFRNAAAQDAFEALLREEIPTPPAMLAAGGWVYTLRPMGGLCLALAAPEPQTDAEVSFLRLPLSDVFNAASALMPAVEATEDPAVHRRAAGLNRGLFRLYRAISNLELTSAEVTPHFSQVDLTALLSRLQTQIPRPCAGGVTVEAELPSRALPVITDPQLLERAVLNLLSNAIRHADPGSAVRLTLKKQKDRALICVENSGLPADPNAVFGDAERARLQGTAGLGLAVARKIMCALGGTLLLQMPGGGTSAMLALPADQNQPCRRCCRSPEHDYSGGFNHVLLELSDVLPAEVFLPQAIE